MAIVISNAVDGTILNASLLNTNFANVVAGISAIPQAVTSILTGNGMTNSAAGTVVTVGLASTGVNAGSYTLASVTVDATGRIIAAANGTSSGGGGLAVSTGVGLANVVSANGINISLANTTVTAGSYARANISVDAQGRITSVSNASAPYVVGGMMLGTQASASQLVMVHKFSLTATFPINFGLTNSGAISVGGTMANATNTTNFFIQHCNAISDPTNNTNWANVGVITVKNATSNATFLSTSNTTSVFPATDYIRIVGNTTIDLTLANLFFTLAGDR